MFPCGPEYWRDILFFTRRAFWAGAFFTLGTNAGRAYRGLHCVGAFGFLRGIGKPGGTFGIHPSSEIPVMIAAPHVLTSRSQLPDDMKDHYKAEHGTTPSADVLTFCKRELMQRIWLLLLDEEFMKAYEHGILVTCGDGVIRRIFPRIFSYSADYPEK